MSRAVKSLPGVDNVVVDLASRQVRVSYDPAQVSLDILKGAIVEAGYDVEA